MDFSKINPWVYFLIFSVANALLAYSSLSYLAKGWIFLGGILVPALTLFMAPAAPAPKDFLKKELFKAGPSPWVILFLAVTALLLRFYRLTSFHLWLTGDEALHGFLAIPLSEKWNWQFFYTVGEHPPLLIWTLGFFFKWFNSPFFNLWFLPAFFSSLAFPLGYLTARLYFSRSFSLLLGLLWAFSFWPLYFGRYCHQSLFIPFLELAVFYFLGRCLKDAKPKSAAFWAFGLGLVTGLGSLTFTSWAVVALLAVFTVVVAYLSQKLDSRSFLFFLGGLFLGSMPFFLGALREGYGHHLIDSSAASHWFSTSHQFVTYLSYLTCLFWGNLQPGASYAPLWGGILNPVLASCFFLGGLELFRLRREIGARWLGLGFVLCLLPAFLAADYVEFNRILQVMPFLLFFTAVGLQKILQAVPSRHRGMTLAALLLVSFGLDLNHLGKITLDGPLWKLEFKKDVGDENFRAYQILEGIQRSQGPGLVFTDFLLLSHNHSLNVTTYHFNAVLNPRLDAVQARWAGLMVNIHYQPFLQKKFPNSAWYPLPSPKTGDGGMVLGVIPITSENQGLFNHWVEVHRYFHGLSLQAENILNNRKRYQEALEHLPQGYPVVQGDPFLESCFGEWLAQYHFGPTCEPNIRVVQRAIAKGYPAAHLYYKLGNFYFINRQFKEAKQAFIMAAKSKPNYTDAQEVLARLWGGKE